jgi:site-specific recombinase XerD
MIHLLPILQRRGLAAAAPPRAPFEGLLSDFDAYQAEVRGASDETRSLTRRTIAPVLSTLMRRGRFDAARLTGPALQQYVAATAERRAPSTVARVVVAIRSLLRFLQARGFNTAVALTMLKGPRRSRFRPSRKALTPAQLRALLAPLRRSQEPIALRDLAILLLLGQVGLRRADVAHLQLNDFEGRTGTLTVRRSKSRRAFELPVPEDARDAVLMYVRRGRPEMTTNALFAAHAFPYDRGITASAVSAVVERAFRRSGVQHPSHGAHVLRHTLATQLVAARQPLKAIADVMRHKDIDTTAIYVRVDLDRLRAAARPWPERQHDARA